MKLLRETIRKVILEAIHIGPEISYRITGWGSYVNIFILKHGEVVGRAGLLKDRVQEGDYFRLFSMQQMTPDGLGPTLCDLAIEYATENGDGLIAYGALSDEMIPVLEYYKSNRPDVETFDVPNKMYDTYQQSVSDGTFFKTDSEFSLDVLGNRKFCYGMRKHRDLMDKLKLEA